jgi:UDP-N-acetylglucosamine 4-epimerase
MSDSVVSGISWPLFHQEDITKVKFCVTGGAGFIGSNIVEYLLQWNASKVIVLDNLSTGKIENIDPFLGHPNFSFVRGDIRDLNLCKELFKEVDVISHQAALGSVPRSIKDPISSNEVNVSGFLNVLYAAVEANVSRVVYAASSSTYGDSLKLPKIESEIGRPLSPYAVTKLVNELYADVFKRVYGLDTIGLRYFNVFGPKQDPHGVYAAVIPKFIDAALKNKVVKIDGSGDQTRDFTFIVNAVEANIKALVTTNNDALNEVYNVACGEQTSILDLWLLIAKQIGTENDPEFGDSRKGDVKHSLADISKAKVLLNYTGSAKVGEGLRITCEHFRKKFFAELANENL